MATKRKIRIISQKVTTKREVENIGYIRPPIVYALHGGFHQVWTGLFRHFETRGPKEIRDRIRESLQ